MSFGKVKLGYDATDADTLAASDIIGATILNASIAVTATNLDIRDLTHVSDSVKIGDGVDLLAISASGAALVEAVNLDIRDLTAVSDSVQAWAFDGTGNAITSSSSALDVNLQSSDIALTVSDLANTAIESTAKSVTSTTGVILASQLANRKFFLYQNLGLSFVYIGKSGVTTSNGFRMGSQSEIMLRLGPALSLHAVGLTVGGVDTRVMELS